MFAEDYRELNLPGAAEVASRCILFEDFIENFEARIAAMARTHQLLVEGGWENMSLKDLLSAAD